MIVCADNYYWYKDKKIPLYTGNKEYIIYEPDPSVLSKGSEILYEDDLITSSRNTPLKWGIIPKGANLVTKKILYRSTSYFIARTDSVELIDSVDAFVTNKFYVKLKQSEDVEILHQMATLYDVEFLGSHTLKDWYTMRCKEDAQYDALEMANIFYESGKFGASEPELMSPILPACVNDTHFNLQWNLNNSGTYGEDYNGIDINYCHARTITSGSDDVIIAVYDSGVDTIHPDLNIHPVSFDTYTATSPARINGYHGTACAGIIAGQSNNNLGISGIAPSCPIMSISIHNQANPEQIANGFIFAADNGCSVISCSWSYYVLSEFIDNAISYALENGRNGLGCVVAFASGNDNSRHINYPANCDERIIVVGAMSPCGQRKSLTSCDGENWGSNYGVELDVVAPGVSIPTTDRTGTEGKNSTDYILGFNGTSAACPHVAAIAGLLLSINPYLTTIDISNIIESTAQKIGNYTYSIEDNRPNGQWNKKVGYGLVDAYAAILQAKTKYIQNKTYQSGNNIVEKYSEIIVGHSVTNNVPYGDVLLEIGSDVTFKAIDKVILKPGFHAQSGCKLHIVIDTPNLLQSDVVPQCVASRPYSTPANNTGLGNEAITSNHFENIESEMIQSTSIYTISGQLLHTIEDGQRDAANLPNGIYILQHRMSDGSIRSEKIANNK